MNTKKSDYYFEVTDTFQGEANYCWLRRYKISAKSELGAIQKLARHTGLKFRKQYDTRYNAINACVCTFLIDSDYTIERDKEKYESI